MDSESPGEFTLRQSVLPPQTAEFENLGLHQPCMTVAFSPGVPPLGDGIQGVLILGPETEVAGSDAPGGIAAVHHTFPRRNKPDK
jgi:hypothetical protein